MPESRFTHTHTRHHTVTHRYTKLSPPPRDFKSSTVHPYICMHGAGNIQSESTSKVRISTHSIFPGKPSSTAHAGRIIPIAPIQPGDDFGTRTGPRGDERKGEGGLCEIPITRYGMTPAPKWLSFTTTESPSSSPGDRLRSSAWSYPDGTKTGE